MPDPPKMEVTQESIAALLTQVTEQNRLIALLLGKVEALEFKASTSTSPSPPTEAPSAPPNPPHTETPTAVNAPSEHADSNPNAPPHVQTDVVPAAPTEPEGLVLPKQPWSNEDNTSSTSSKSNKSNKSNKSSKSSKSSTSSTSSASEAASSAAPSTPSPASPSPESMPALHPGAQPFPSIFAPHPFVRNYPPQFYYQYPSFYPPPMWPVSPNGAASPGGPMGFYPPIPFPHIPGEGASSERGAQPSTPSVSSERPTLEPEAAPKKKSTKPASAPRQDAAGGAANASAQSDAGKTRKCRLGVDCTWGKKCMFEHPERSTSSPSTMANNSATNGASGSGGDSKPARNGKISCRSGMSCTRVDCWYNHPPGWTAPDEADAEGTWGEDNHAVTPATDNTTGNGWGDESQAAERDNAEGEDADIDFGNWADPPPADWGAPPNNDWGTPAGDTWGAPANNDSGAPPNNDKKTSQKRENPTAPRETDKDKKKKAQRVERPAATNSTTAATTRPSTRAPSVTPSSHAPSIAPSRAPSVTPSSRAPSSRAPASRAPSSRALSSRAPSVQRTEPTNDVTLDVLDTPSLDRTDTPSSPPSEPETPTAPFSWADEPCAITVASSEEPPETQPSSPQIQQPEDSLLDVPTEDDANDNADKAPVDPVDLDEFAPSKIYDSWAPSVADWGFIAEEPAAVDDANPKTTSNSDYNTWAPKEDYSWGDPPSEPEDNGAKLKKKGGSTSTARDNGRTGGFENKPSAKAKGKGKENPQGQTASGSQPKNKSGGQSKSNPSTASSHLSTSVATGSSTPTTSLADSTIEPPLSVLPVLQPPPPGVPEEDIPDWLLGAGEDPHETLGFSRAPTPEPPSPAPVKPVPSRSKLQNMPGESFPALRPPPVHEPAATSVASDTVIRPKRRGWTILPDPPAPGEDKATKSSGQQRKKSYYGRGKRST
ncbi:hypothetical protein BDV93DRAFT_246072 [Ceratobasidium sp. AG-I]|nr:hypothetical protein BDV93DRAFT_246072 [Ceratobasidium sp. AG-I]